VGFSSFIWLFYKCFLINFFAFIGFLVLLQSLLLFLLVRPSRLDLFEALLHYWSGPQGLTHSGLHYWSGPQGLIHSGLHYWSGPQGLTHSGLHYWSGPQWLDQFGLTIIGRAHNGSTNLVLPLLVPLFYIFIFILFVFCLYFFFPFLWLCLLSYFFLLFEMEMLNIGGFLHGFTLSFLVAPK
jgi:hypothetical protein